jgi:hypothetical protein
MYNGNNQVVELVKTPVIIQESCNWTLEEAGLAKEEE